MSFLGDLRCFLLTALEFVANSLKPDMDVKFQFADFYSKSHSAGLRPQSKSSVVAPTVAVIRSTAGHVWPGHRQASWRFVPASALCLHCRVCVCVCVCVCV